jgi:hypothetical protein
MIDAEYLHSKDIVFLDMYSESRACRCGKNGQKILFLALLPFLFSLCCKYQKHREYQRERGRKWRRKEEMDGRRKGDD